MTKVKRHLVPLDEMMAKAKARVVKQMNATFPK